MVWCANATLPTGVENCDLLGTIKGSSYSCISLAAYNAAAKSLTFIYNGCHLFQTVSTECHKSDCLINVEANSRGNYCCCNTDFCNENATAANVEVQQAIYRPAPIRYEAVHAFARAETTELIAHEEEYSPMVFILLAVLSITILALLATVIIQKCVCSRRARSVNVVDVKEGVAVEGGISGEYKSHRENALKY